MMRLLDLRAAIPAVAIAAFVAGAAGVRAVRIDPIPAAAGSSPVAMTTDPSVHWRAATEPAVIEQVAARNPFHPERRRGGTFRLPAEREVPGTATIAAAPAGREVRLVGTAVGGDGDFVVCAVGREDPRIVRLGGRCGQLLLESVSQGTATFTDPAGERVDLEVPKAGSQ